MTRALPLLIALGCAPLPALITDAQVRAVLPAVHHEAGTRCAARLNGHVRAARAAGVARPVAPRAGALLLGVDGACLLVGADAEVDQGAHGVTGRVQQPGERGAHGRRAR